MIPRRSLLVLSLLALAPSRASASRNRRLSIRVGFQRRITLDARGAARLESAGGIAEVDFGADENDLIVYGMRRGRTTFKLYMEDGSQRIYDVTVF